MSDDAKNSWDKRTKEIKIRLTDNEFAKLQQRRTKNLAGWLRDLALGAVPIRQADPALVHQVARIGSNLNQIARHANTEKIGCQCVVDIKWQ